VASTVENGFWLQILIILLSLHSFKNLSAKIDQIGKVSLINIPGYFKDYIF
jgi:hypothetical protein